MSQEIITENENKWCFAWLAEKPSEAGTERVALMKAAKWIPGSIIGSVANSEKNAEC